MGRMGLSAALVLSLAAQATAFYLPGTARDYKDGDAVEIDVNVLTSINTHLPYEYYSLPFCKPKKGSIKKDSTENLGELLLGNRIRRSPYEEVQMGINFPCKTVCEPIRMDSNRKRDLEDRIQDDYRVSLLLDNLPVTVMDEESGTATPNVPIGTHFDQDGKPKFVLFNHLEFTIRYNRQTVVIGAEEKEAKRVVSFLVRPFSVKHEVEDASFKRSSCDEKFAPSKADTIALTTEDEYLTFTYSVKWEETTDDWATRWDPYLSGGDSEIHWFSIINSSMVVLFLTALMAIILTRTLRRDIAIYNKDLFDDGESQDQTGWKMVHTEVFRPPPYHDYLACYVGTGAQFLGMSLAVLLFAALGFVSPGHRGLIATMMLLCFAFLGAYGGYTAARLTKLWGKFDWKPIIMTALLVPGECFMVFFIINLAIWREASSAALPFWNIVVLILLWFGISCPLIMGGAVMGFRRDAITIPVRIHLNPRDIPEQPIYMHWAITALIGGLLPFGAVFIEVFFILSSIWLNKYYYVFGFLFLVFVIVLVTCAEISIVVTYFQLCQEDYNWWWRAFFTSGASGVYMFLYSSLYFFTSAFKMQKFASVLLFFGYMGLFSYIFSIMTGTIGFAASLLFVRKIYGEIKVD